MFTYQGPLPHGCHLSPWENKPAQKVSVHWLPICLIHSPTSISQLHALSSIDKIRLLLAMVPWKGSRRFPLNNISWMTAAAPKVKDMPGQPHLLPSNVSSSSSSRSRSRPFRPSSLQDASQAFCVYSTLDSLPICLHFADRVQTGVFLGSCLKYAPRQSAKHTVTVKF